MRRINHIPFRLFLVVSVLAMSGALASAASASQLIDRNATKVHLAVNQAGIALLTYTKQGRVYHVLAKGAINARQPVKGGKQVAFKLDRAGGWGFFHKSKYWKTFKNVCEPYDGPALAWYVTACTMPDGSYWAVQAWQRLLANYGLPSVGPRNAPSFDCRTGIPICRC
jgi:hypothetical protein